LFIISQVKQREQDDMKKEYRVVKDLSGERFVAIEEKKMEDPYSIKIV
jgi:hypothetical protein